MLQADIKCAELQEAPLLASRDPKVESPRLTHPHRRPPLTTGA